MVQGARQRSFCVGDQGMGQATGVGGSPGTDRATVLRRRMASALVHVFTASGIVCALLALLAILEGRYVVMFAWLGVALVIDGVDGTFARWVDVQRWLPRFSGERLDLVIDYVTYVLVPALALRQAGMLPGAFGTALVALILMSSLYHFSDNASKTEDHCFVGFPAIWNVVAFYLFAFAAPVWVATAVVLVCVGATFVPMRWLHPMRVERLRWVNVAVLGLASLAALWTLWRGFPADALAKMILGAAAAYIVWLSVTWPLAEPGTGKSRL